MNPGSADSFRSALSGTGADIGGERDDEQAPTPARAELNPNALTTEQSVRSGRSLLCPCCRGPKKRMRTLCGGCYHNLPAAMKRALYSRAGAGYEEAIAAAFKHIQVQTFTMPPETPK